MNKKNIFCILSCTIICLLSTGCSKTHTYEDIESYISRRYPTLTIDSISSEPTKKKDAKGYTDLYYSVRARDSRGKTVTFNVIDDLEYSSEWTKYSLTDDLNAYY